MVIKNFNLHVLNTIYVVVVDVPIVVLNIAKAALVFVFVVAMCVQIKYYFK